MLLDVRRVGDEPRAELLGDLPHHAVVVQRAPRLHHAHDGGFDLRLAVVVHARARLLRRRLALLARAHRADLDAHQLGGERVVEVKRVALLDALRRRVLA